MKRTFYLWAATCVANIAIVITLLVMNVSTLKAGGPCDNFPDTTCFSSGTTQCGLGNGAYCYKNLAGDSNGD